MNPQTQEQLESLRGTANGEALRDYITEQVNKISDIRTLTPENVEARKKACEILELLFSFLGKDKPQITKSRYN